MPLKFIRAFNTGSIAAGDSYEKEFSTYERWKLKHVILLERGGGSLYNVQFYLKIGEDVITRDYAPAHIFHPDSRYIVEINKDVEPGTPIYFKLTNSESAAINVDVVFVVEE